MFSQSQVALRLRSCSLADGNLLHVVRAFPDLAPGTLACPRGCTHLEPDCALDDWVRDQGDRFARGLAAERELRARGEVERQESLEREATTEVAGAGEAIDGLDLGG